MRRDVRLLGDLLGEVISESAGPDLLADVERLRHAVIAARSAANRGSAQATAEGDSITALVSSWSWERAELVARAFTVYFHLINLAEEQQRVRTLRQRDSGDRPPRESFADAVSRLTAEGGAGQLAEALAGLRVHPVFTAHPTEARRRAVVASLRRVSGLLTSVDDDRAGSAQQAEDRRKLREEVDLLWRTAQLRVAGMTPADEVRVVMTAFDETLFRLVPVVYRSLDHVLLGDKSGAEASPVPPFLRFGSWVGGDRDGNPNVTAAVTREAAVIQAEHALRGLEAACGRIARALTVYEEAAPASPELRRALARRGGRPARADGRDLRPARRASRTGPTCSTRASGWPPPGPGTSTWPTPARPTSSPTCAWCSPRWPPTARSGRPTVSCSTCCGRPRRSASTSRAWRCASTRGCTPVPWRSCGPGPRARR